MSEQSATPAPATGTGRKTRELWFPGMLVVSVGLALVAFIANVTGLGLLGEREGFVGVDILGTWWMIAAGVAAHAGFIYASYLLVWAVYPRGHVGAMLLAAAFPLSTLFYTDPTIGLGGILCLLAIRFAAAPTFLVSAVCGIAASLFTPAAIALVVVYVFGILAQKGKTFAWLGLITAFVTVETHDPLHQLASAAWETYAPVGGVLVASLVVWATTRKSQSVMLWVTGAAVLVVSMRAYTVYPLLLVVWLPVSVTAAATMRRGPLAVLAVAALGYGAWVSATAL